MANRSFNMETETRVGNEFDLKALILRLVSLWPYIAFSILCTLFISFIYLRYVTPIYKSSTSILIKDEKKGGGAALDNALLKELNLAANGKLIDNEIELLKSYDLMEQVVSSFGLNVSIRSKGRFAERALFNKLPFNVKVEKMDSSRGLSILVKRDEEGKLFWKFNRKDVKFSSLNLNQLITINGYQLIFSSGDSSFNNRESAEGNTEYILRVLPIRDATISFLSSLKVEAASKTASVINLEFNDPNQDRATTVLHELINVYIQNGLFDKNQLSARTVDFLDKRLSLIESELRGVEQKVADYKRLNNLTDISEESKTFLNTVADIDIKRADQQTRMNVIQALETEILNNQDNPALVPSTLGLAEPTLLSLIERHNSIVLQRERTVALSGPKNPGLLDLNGQIKEIRIKLLENIRNLKKSFIIALNNIELQERDLKYRLKEIPAIEQNLLEIKRDLSVKEQLYYFLLEKREESAIVVASAVTDSRIIERARPNGAVSPKRNTVWFLGLSLGFLLPILIFLLVDYFDNKIGSRKEIEDNCDAPILGEIAFVKSLDNPIVMGTVKRSAVSEQIRSIRTALSYTQKGSSLKRFLITSHRSGEGKSFTSLNLAYSYVLTNKKVVILEFDLRRPRISKNLNITSNKGITTYLNGQSTLEEVIVKIPEYGDNFAILPAGPIPPNPAELILGPYMAKLIEELNANFDIIVFDTPPFGLVTDANLLFEYVDVSIVVLRQGYSFKNVYKDINEVVRLNPDRFIYSILNGVGQRNKYSYYGYSYGYGYNNYYGDAPKKGIWKRILGFFKL